MTLARPTVVLEDRDVQTLALAIHDLANNAHEYGAFAGHAGRLHLGWWKVPAGDGHRLRVEWIEEGIAPAEAARGDAALGGCGRELIEQVPPQTKGAAARYAIDGTSVKCTIRLPRARSGDAGVRT